MYHKEDGCLRDRNYLFEVRMIWFNAGTNMLMNIEIFMFDS